MRYAIVTETYPPEINGVALTVQGMEQGLRARGHQVQLIRPAQREEAQAIAASITPPADLMTVKGMPLPRYPQLRFGLPSRGKLLQRWSRERPDAVYVATEGPLGSSALGAARHLGIPAVTGFHTRFDLYAATYGCSPLRPLVLNWMRRFHHRADATLVPTRELQNQLKDMGFRNVECLPRAVDCTRFSPAKRDASLRTGWGLGRRDLAVLHFGRIAGEKNLELAIAAFRTLQLQRPDAKYIWVGDGPLREEIAADNPDFVFMGALRGEALARTVASTDLFPFASESETFGNVTLEAMASGVPVIAFDYGAAHEFLRHGIHGEAIRLGDRAGFVDALVRCGINDANRADMALASRQAMERLRPEQVAADLDGLLHRLIERRAQNAKAVLA